MNKIKITNHQLFSLTANGAIGGSVLLASSVLASIAKQDAWMAAIPAAALGIPIIWIYWFLGSRYPCMTLIGIINKILGKWIGLIVSAGYVFLFLAGAIRLPWYIGTFITAQAMPETPIYIINSLFTAGLVIALLYGIETIARACELFLYFVAAIFLAAMVLALPNARIENLQPVFEKGIIPVLKASVFFSCFTTFPSIILMMIYPVNIDNITEAKKSLLKGYLWAVFITFISILMSILVLGSTVTARSQYPAYTLAKEINVGVIFSRLEFVIAAVWLITQFMVGILFFYAGIMGLSELLGLKDYRRIVIPTGLTVFIMSGTAFSDVISQANWFVIGFTPYYITHGLIVPILLLVVFLIKKWIFKQT